MKLHISLYLYLLLGFIRSSSGLEPLLVGGEGGVRWGGEGCCCCCWRGTEGKGEGGVRVVVVGVGVRGDKAMYSKCIACV